MIEGFMLGVLATMFVTAGAYFLKFWMETRDFLFLAFAASFAIEGISRVFVLFQPRPNESSPWIYLVRLFASLLLLAAILKKNYGKDA